MKVMWKLLGITLLLVCNGVNAQVALLDRVPGFIEGKDYSRAIEAISLAESNTITSTDPRTYYLKSFIYKDLFVNESNPELKDSLLSIAVSSLKKSRELDKTDLYTAQLSQLETFFYSSYYNQGVERFNAADYPGAVVSFKQFLDHTSDKNPYWLDANYYTAIAHQVQGDKDSTFEAFRMLAARNYGQPLLYSDLALLYADIKDEPNAFNTLKKGLTKYPDNKDLQLTEVNLLSRFEHYSQLEERLQQLLEQDANNTDILLMLATAYGKNRVEENRDEYYSKIERTYLRVITLLPDNFEANFNLGVLYYNEAVDIINKNDYDISLQELTIILERSSELFQKARPYLEGIYQKQKTVKLLVALQAIYYNLNMLEELDQISKEMDSLTE